jgi:hypothetical protein
MMKLLTSRDRAKRTRYAGGRGCKGMVEPRTAKLVIDQAIRENRGASILCYALVILFAFTGVAVLIGGAFAREGLVSLAGSIASMLFWPALNQARQIRELNLSIRLLEIPLSRADNAQEAADALRVVFLQRFQVKEQQ